MSQHVLKQIRSFFLLSVFAISYPTLASDNGSGSQKPVDVDTSHASEIRRNTSESIAEIDGNKYRIIKHARNVPLKPSKSHELGYPVFFAQQTFSVSKLRDGQWDQIGDIVWSSSPTRAPSPVDCFLVTQKSSLFLVIYAETLTVPQKKDDLDPSPPVDVIHNLWVKELDTKEIDKHPTKTPDDLKKIMNHEKFSFNPAPPSNSVLFSFTSPGGYSRVHRVVCEEKDGHLYAHVYFKRTENQLTLEKEMVFVYKKDGANTWSELPPEPSKDSKSPSK